LFVSGVAVTEIYLVRHGETDWNRAGRLQGRIDTRLNRNGVTQAHQVAVRFRGLARHWREGATVVTSPLERARRMARTIALRNQSELEVDPLLVEIDHGAWAGLTISNIARTAAGLVIDGHLQPEALDAGGGETLASAYIRASTALRRLVATSRTAPVVVVSHGVTNALLMCAALGEAPVRMDQHTQPNGCSYRLRFQRGVLIDVGRV
jgi:probable phosphoglycerate mutase